MKWIQITKIISKSEIISNFREVLFEKNVTNETEDYADAPWSPTYEVETKYIHHFTLKNKQEIRGIEFTTAKIDSLMIPLENGPSELTGEEFSYQLSLPFTFKDETQAIKMSRHTLIMKLPHLIPPRCNFKVLKDVDIHESP